MKHTLWLILPAILASCNPQPAFPADETIPIQTVFLEASGEPMEGKIAVAEVIRNRAKRSGESFDEVCLKPNQFSCWNSRVYSDLRLFQMTGADWQAASRAWVESEFSNITNGSTHFHTISISPSWSRKMKRTVRISNHQFYKEK